MSPTLDRRQVMIAGLTVLGLAGLGQSARAALAVPPGGVLDFEVHRKGQLLGNHRMTFERQGKTLTARTQVDFLVKLGPLSLFHYSHQAHEVWTDGQFESLETASSTNGHAQKTQAHRANGGVMIEPAEGQAYVADSAILPLTHWNKQVMNAPLFNPQDGKLLREKATERGQEVVQTADGRSLNATRYSLIGDSPIDDWYDQDGVWVALQGKVKDGSTLIYRRV